MEQKSIERWGRPVNTYHVTQVEGGGHRANYKFVPDKSECELLTSQIEYSQSCECLGPSLAVKHPMMTSSMLFECKPLSPPASTSRPPDVIHVISVPRPFLFFPKMLIP